MPSSILDAILGLPRAAIREVMPVASQVAAPVMQIFGSRIAGMIPEDEPYWRQYMTPESGKLPAQTLRPRAATIPAGEDVRQTALPQTFTAGFTQMKPDEYTEPGERRRPVLITPAQLDRLKVGDIIKNVEPFDRPSSDVRTLEGLGRYRGSIGRDDKGVYWSAYDRWDMHSPNIPSWVKNVLEGAGGNSYAVYDRFRITPVEKGPLGFYTFLREQGAKE